MSKKLVTCKHCGAEIAKSAKVCPQCGGKNKQHKALGIALVILGVLLIIGGLGGTSSSDPKEAPVTLAEFNEVKTGMTYEEVVAIIGFDGEPLSETDIGLGEEFATAMYMWSNEDLSGMEGIFQGGKLISKSQINLE